MSFLAILPSYIFWHYTAAFGDIVRVWTNFLWFFYNFFSIPLLLKTFFAPWKRIQEGKGEGFNLENIAEAVVTNTIMRVVGAVVRFVMLLFGSFSVLIVFWLGATFFLVWALWPLLIVASLFNGIAAVLS